VQIKLNYLSREQYEAKGEVCPSCGKDGGIRLVQDVTAQECLEVGDFCACKNCDELMFIHDNPPGLLVDINPVAVEWNITQGQFEE